MKRFLLAVAVAMLLSFGLLGAVSSQSPVAGKPAAELQPLLVRIEQKIPFSVTLSVPGSATETLTMTVPAVIDLNLALSLAGTLTPTVQAITSTQTARIAVSDLQKSGTALVDNHGLAYQLEGPDSVEVIQWRVDEDFAGNLNMTGEFRNAAKDRALKLVHFVVTLYDSDGNILGVASGYQSLDSVAPGGTSPFRVSTSVPLKSVARYLVQVEE